jgi:predicted permease
MMKTEKPAVGQLVAGIVIGLVLTPIGVMTGASIMLGDAGRGDPLAGLGVLMNGVMFFGSLQAISLLPGALVARAFGKRGIAAGILYLGCFLAILNGILWIIYYRDYGHPPIY